jgi:hypothetical protein
VQKLTLKGYLSSYVRHLSGLDTNSINRLANEAMSNHRLREPLFLYAYCTDKVDLLLEYTRETEMGDRFYHIRSKFSLPEIISALETKNSILEERYHKCYNSYVCRRDMQKTYERKKYLMRTKILELQAVKKVTTYRIYTDLGLNGSNVNSFVKNNKIEKLSLDTVRMILKYLEK